MNLYPDSGQSGRRRSGRRSGALLLAAATLIPAGLIVLPTTILIVAGMLPTIVAFIIDRDPEKSAPITVGAMNFCGVMPFAIQLWEGGHSMPVVMGLLSAPVTWFLMYGAAGIGWLLYYGLPPIIAAAVVFRDEVRMRDLDAQRRELVEEWGPDVITKTPQGQDAKSTGKSAQAPETGPL